MSGNILIAEDEVPIRELLQAIFRDEGSRVAVVEDGQAALEALAATRYDVVLSNVMMPRLDGCGLANAMHADPALQHIPLILMSAAGARLALEVPQSAYVPQPFGLGHLLTVVERVLDTAAD